MIVTPEVTVVLPTYREKDNLVRLLPQLFGVFSQHKLEVEVIVIDDDSRDGTTELCHELATQHLLRLISRRGERGLATAVLRGLREAAGDICVVMDADLSHPPDTVPVLVEAARLPDCDIAIGSRFVAGSNIDKDWGWMRWLNSKVASLLARGLTPVSDPMSGFFAIKQSVLSRAMSLRPVGYKIGLELIVRCDCRCIVEIPITFRDRRIGKSKLSLAQQLLYLRHLSRLYAVRYLKARVASKTVDTLSTEKHRSHRRAA